MSQPNKSANTFAYLRHARQTPTEPVEEIIPDTTPSPKPEAIQDAPIISSHPVRLDAKTLRVKFTTNIAPQLRNTVELEIAKQKTEGKTQSFADVIDELLRSWLRIRGVAVDQ